MDGFNIMMPKTDAIYSQIFGLTWFIFVVIHDAWLVKTTSRQEHEEVIDVWTDRKGTSAAAAGGGWNPPVELFPAKQNESGVSGGQIDERCGRGETLFLMDEREEEPLPSRSIRSCPGRQLILIPLYCTV